MRILHNWIQQYIKFTIPPEELGDRLGMLGLEIAGMERLGEKYTGFVVGQVMEKRKHPNADKLSVCSVNTGKEVLQVVCGASNVEPAQKVAVGLIGTMVPRSQHDPSGAPFVLSQVKIRGVDSFGMICSEYELDLGKDADGILVLDSEAKVGQPLAEYLGLSDIAYEMEITPNRPDWLSHIGVAREIGVLIGKPASLPCVRVRESKTPVKDYLSVTVKDRKNCPRFTARVIQGVTIAPSPQWLQNTLRNAGLRPRNNVVDVTNFVMLECGQPLHAFDYARLKGKRILVRQAEPGHRFTTLDGKEHTLPEGAVMVCDAERAISIAGIMGGANSEISDATTDIVLEAAYWNPSSIRKTAKALGISTDASQRFERGADPEASTYAIDRAASLILETAGGNLLKGKVTVRSGKVVPRIVTLRTSRVNEILGTSIEQAEIVRLLSTLGFRPVRKGKENIQFRIPSYRVDVDREIDLIEEVARAYGYNNIDEKTTASVNFLQPFPQEDDTETVRQALVALGVQEAISSSLQDLRTARLTGEAPIELLNAGSQEMSTLRTSLLPGLLQAVARNSNFGNSSVRLFEIGHVYSIDESFKPKTVENFLEVNRVCLVLTGMASPRHWSEKPRLVDPFDIKGEVQNLFAKIALDKSRFIYYSTSNSLAENAVAVEINGSYAGCFGEAKGNVLKMFGIDQPVFFAELDLRALTSSKERRNYSLLPRFPRVRRDVAFIVDSNVPSERLEYAIRSASARFFQSVELFDVYQGERLPDGKKSLAYTLELMSLEKTLTDLEIEAEIRVIVQRVERDVGALLRAE